MKWQGPVSDLGFRPLLASGITTNGAYARPGGVGAVLLGVSAADLSGATVSELSVLLNKVPGMRRAYIDAHCELTDSFRLARAWAGPNLGTLMAPSTGAVDASPWLLKSGVSIGTVGGRRSRYAGHPQGVVIAWCLNLDEVLEIEHRYDIEGIVLVRAHKFHAPWITAHEAEHLGGQVVAPISEASTAIKAAVEGISWEATRNQGLVDSRERSDAVQTLTYLHNHGHRLVPDQLVTEAIRNGWGGQGPLDLAEIAKQLNAGKQLRYQKGRIRPERLAEWANA